MTIWHIIAGIFLPCLTVFGIALWLAPEGWEDSEGWHSGREGDD